MVETPVVTPLRDYLSLLKLRIAALILLVAASGYLVTTGPAIEPLPFAILLASGLLASGGASAVNHYVDRDLDGLMARTSRRPIPSGRVRPFHALVLGFLLLAASMALALAINLLTAAFIALGFVVYVFVYTIALKRKHVSNIVIGGLAGSCPALAGSAAASGAVGLGALLIALLVFLWTPGHFWALAYVRRDDYRRAGIPMLPVVMDEKTTVTWIVASTALVPPFALLFWVLQVSGFAYLAVAVVAGAVLMAFAVRFLRSPTVQNAWIGYRASGPYLAAILVGLMVDSLLRGF
jgi:protoheme IX farnesyltransferase